MVQRMWNTIGARVAALALRLRPWQMITLMLLLLVSWVLGLILAGCEMEGTFRYRFNNPVAPEASSEAQATAH